MTSHLGYIAGLVAVASLLSTASLAVQTAAPNGTTPKQASQLANRTPGPVSQIQFVEPLRDEAERLAAYENSYDQVIDDDRDLASKSSVAPVQVQLSARIDVAFQYAAKSHLAEAKAALAEAEAALATDASNLGAGLTRRLRINIELCHGAIAGDEAREGASADVATKLAEARSHYAAALAMASSPLDQIGGPASQTIQQGDIVTIDRARADSANAAADVDASRRNGGARIARSIDEGEILAVLAARANYGLGQVMFRAGDLAASQKANSDALDKLPPGAPAWLKGVLLRQRATLQVARGDLIGADKSLDAAIQDVEQAEGTSRLEARLLRDRAAVHTALGKPDDAVKYQKASFDILADQSDGVWPTAAEVDPYLKLLGPKATAGDKAAVAEFFTVASVATETSTASTLSDVAARFASADTDVGRLLRRLQEAHEKVRAANARLARINSLPSDKVSKGDKDAAQDELTAARVAEKAASDAVTSNAGSRGGAVLSPKATLADVQSVLRPGETYVRFIFLDDGAGYVFAATKTSAQVAKLGASEGDIEKAVNALRASTTPSGPSGEVEVYSPILAKNLYDALFGGVAALVAPSHELIIEPSGPLYSLPFIALVTASPDNQTLTRILSSGGHDYRGVAWLGRDKAVVLSVSSAAFVRLRAAKPSTAPLPILAFADPTPTPRSDTATVEQVSLHRAEAQHLLNAADPDAARKALGLCGSEAEVFLSFDRLPDSQTEAASAVSALRGDPGSALVVGDHFTDVGVEKVKDLDRYKVLLFSTHTDLPDPKVSHCWTQPVLLTSHAASPDSEGTLDTLAISNLQLNADLVVLSACNTANGNDGQALSGLAQAFILAGSRGLVVTHWEIPSKATSSLVSAYFKSMGEGTPRTSALMKAEATLMDDDKRSHPYYWAAFTSVSDGS